MESVALGPVIYTAVKPIFKIYFIISCGYFLGRRNVLTVETSRNISDIIVSLILPCLIFTKIVTNLQNSDIKQIGIICLVYLLQTLIGGLGGMVAYLIGKPKFWLGGCLSVSLLPNISDLPIAYLQTFAPGLVFTEKQGEKGVAYICIFTAFQILMQFNCGMFKLIGYDINQQKRAQESVNALEKKIESDDQTTDSQSERIVPEIVVDNASDVGSYSSNDDDDDETEDQTRYEDQVIPLTEPSGVQRSQSHVSNISLRRSRSQTMNELVREYSQAASLAEGMQAAPAALTDLQPVPSNKTSGKTKTILSQLKTFGLFVLDNCKRPISIALILSITVSMIPWTKALFTTTNQATLPTAPDEQPPLSFVIDFTNYLGNACVPLGLLILGATLSRLEISDVSFHTLLTPLLLTLVRLILLPIIGCAIISGFSRLGWFINDDILRFVCTITWGLPNATTLIYLTAFYTPLEGTWKQMDTLALTYIVEYPLLSISLPFLTTYCIKVGLNY
ncbi:CYFA0S02e08702g1_1 [Cyberlindnera fabianii]|uniref:CYFA0S02e08702g1_1 n=1 Tax=Cyberlindnera fabianii TaxID=36022 RepID=A0A061AMZ6_CYBFA|nr:CYFA0S02e08702g1_1 [Cyberlindnera fabianii]